MSFLRYILYDGMDGNHKSYLASYHNQHTRHCEKRIETTSFVKEEKCFWPFAVMSLTAHAGFRSSK